jgi:phosphatidate cytidylyltransferase
MKRLLTAALLIPIIVYTVLWADFLVFFAVLLTVACLCYREYNRMATGYGFGAPGVLGYGAGFLLLAWRGDAWLMIVLVAILTLADAMRGSDIAKSLPRAALLLTGIIYIFGCWRCALTLRAQNPHWLMFALVMNWAGDAGAYYVGRLWGKHKMAPVVSPKKSWEGAAASMVTSVLVAGWYILRFIHGVSIAWTIGLTVLANVAGQIGDLTESAMKRGAGVKDSGTMLPGHGGFLDRVDSTLFVMPVVCACLRLM